MRNSLRRYIGRWERRTHELTVVVLVLTTMFGGCHFHADQHFSDEWHNYRTLATEIEYPDVEVEPNEGVQSTPSPHTLRNLDSAETWDLSLEEAVRIAMQNSQVMRDLGGRVVTAPVAAPTVFDPAIQETNPLTGPEAALSAFDAQLNSQLFLGHNERTFNNFFFGGGTTGFKQNNANFQAEIAKQSAVGTQYLMRNITTYDRNNSPVNRFPSAFETMFETEFRHPLLQGGGTEFNRIAGPGARAGAYNGVLLARINTDVALVDFEIGVRDLVREVEQTYWELYAAYRNLDAQRRNRDAALRIWRVLKTQLDAGATARDDESLAREQYYAAEAGVEEALDGGSLGQLGVYGVERRLRRLLGLPAADQRIIRPIDEPKLTDFRYDWSDSLAQSFYQRPELRRQQWQIKRRELEVIAAENFRLGRLDLIGLYRWRGFGDDLFGNRNVTNASAFADLFSGDLQDWQVGLQYSNPIGNRLGNTAVRNAELLLARERALYREQELRVSHELADAFAALDRAYVVTKSNYNRRLASYEQVQVKQIRYEAGAEKLDFLLDAIRRATAADITYYRSLTDYHLALLQIQVARGTLLQQHGVELAEGPWSAAAHEAAAKESRRFGPYRGANCLTEPCPISVGTAEDVPPPEPTWEEPTPAPTPLP